MLSFNHPELHSILDRASPVELDDMNFGVVRLNAESRVVHYNVWEARLSGLSQAQVEGRRFFVDVAPCTNNYLVAERFGTERELDAMVDYVFTYRMRPTKVILRLLRSSSREWSYLLVTLPELN
jgi:photoactive yellow protein